ncbi:preprotein translocase subunit YajC [Halanaerocella petrolearia]
MLKIVASIAPWIIMFAIFWFVFIRPQKKKQQEYQEMIKELQRGDKVVTIGGIKATITEVKDDGFELRIAPEVKVDVTQRAIGSLVDKKEEEVELEEAE